MHFNITQHYHYYLQEQSGCPHIHANKLQNLQHVLTDLLTVNKYYSRFYVGICYWPIQDLCPNIFKVCIIFATLRMT